MATPARAREVGEVGERGGAKVGQAHVGGRIHVSVIWQGGRLDWQLALWQLAVPFPKVWAPPSCPKSADTALLFRPAAARRHARQADQAAMLHARMASTCAMRVRVCSFSCWAPASLLGHLRPCRAACLLHAGPSHSSLPVTCDQGHHHYLPTPGPANKRSSTSFFPHTHTGCRGEVGPAVRRRRAARRRRRFGDANRRGQNRVEMLML